MRWFLAAVCMLFIGLLAFTWAAAERANPVFLDERGRPQAMQPR